MGKKIKSKARLDKYYYLAKEHGFRSRAAFKLIQLNKKYQFLESSSCLIDLCAAPGGWMQVAAKYMPVSSIKIGVDLDPIRPVNGCTAFQADITSEKCRFLIKKEIKHFKADVVLNDGAPNVGGLWTKDAYNQSELVLFALKLATEFLKEGGWFITKVFRSSDYNSIMYVLKQLFKKVEATKPQASRSESAEIFVVCQGYKAPVSIDHKLLDPKYALKQLEDEEEMKMNAIKSIKSMFDRKVNRAGYTGKLYNERSLKDFVEATNPYQYLMETNKIKVSTDDCKKYLRGMKAPFEYELYFDDLQILGKKEIQQLIIWRNKLRSKLFKTEKPEKTEEKEEENYEEKKMDELDEEFRAIERQKKKKLEHEKKKREKNEMRQKMSFIDQQEHVTDNAVDFDQKLFDFLKTNNINIEELEYKETNKLMTIPHQTVEEFDLSDISEEEYLNLMNEDIEENMRLFNDTKREPKDKKSKRKKKWDADHAKEDEEEEEEPFEVDGIPLAKKDTFDEENGYKDIALKDYDKDPILDKADLFENPLRKTKYSKMNNNNKKDEVVEKPVTNEEDNVSSDTDSDGDEDDKTLTKKKRKRNHEIELVPQEEIDSDEYDTDEIAEIRAIAKKMLRKKDRLNILYRTYNRYAFDDTDGAPDWFGDEEKMHNKPIKPVTKDEVNVEREMLKKINDRMPKKILEAKSRKRNKLEKRLKRVKKQAQAISNQDDLKEFSKVKQIEKLYKKERSKMKEKKRYVVNRSSRIKAGKNSRTVKHVDKRMKKDRRAVKAKEKRDNK